jgi:hypothetical protein
MRTATPWHIARVALAVIALLVQVGCTGPDAAVAAWHACAMFVQARTGMPADDAEKYDPSGVIDLSGGRYLVEVYYAKAGGSYRCMVLHRVDENWQLMDLSFVR